MRIWPALLLAPLAALGGTSFGYALVTPACERSATWMLHLLLGGCLAFSLGATLLAWTALAGARREFLPLVAFWSGAFFSVVSAAQWAALAFLSPCMH
jgi:hypothetical protein